MAKKGFSTNTGTQDNNVTQTQPVGIHSKRPAGDVKDDLGLPDNASVEDIRDIYLKAHELKCKGITIYRYGSKEQQVLSFGVRRRDVPDRQSQYVVADLTFERITYKSFCSRVADKTGKNWRYQVVASPDRPISVD